MTGSIALRLRISRLIVGEVIPRVWVMMTSSPLRIISPLDIAVFSFDGTPNPFTAVPYEQARQQAMRVAILLDVSGSMGGSIIELQEATVWSLKELSSINSGILCRLTTFNSDFKHSGGFVPCGSLTGEIARLRAGGGTELQAH